MGHAQCQAQKACLVMMAHIVFAIPFTLGQDHPGPSPPSCWQLYRKHCALGLYPLFLPGQTSILAPSMQALGKPGSLAICLPTFPSKLTQGPLSSCPLWMLRCFHTYEYRSCGWRPSQASRSFRVAVSCQASKPGKSCHQLWPWPLPRVYPRALSN